jgi:hypothetical protein
MTKKKVPKLSPPKIEKKKKLKADQFILAYSMGKLTEDLHGEKSQLSDEELYYIAMSVSEMKTIRDQRTVFEMIHRQCDEDSIFRFMEFFSEKDREKIMISC